MVGRVLLISYILYMVVYLIISYIVYRVKFNTYKEEIKNYKQDLKDPYTMYKDEVLKIFSAVSGDKRSGECGSIKVASKKLEIVCGDGKFIIADEIQFKGGKRMNVASYLNGHSIDENIILK